MRSRHGEVGDSAFLAGVVDRIATVLHLLDKSTASTQRSQIRRYILDDDWSAEYWLGDGCGLLTQFRQRPILEDASACATPKLA